MAAFDEPEQDRWLDMAEQEGWSSRQLRKAIKAASTNADTPPLPEGQFSVVVIDPPWDMQKIQRDCQPNQIAMDYKTMTQDELLGIEIPAADDCHLWMWTTHRFLPDALALLDAWGFAYVCTVVWGSHCPPLLTS